MSVLDIDYYKLTMLQFIWKHYAELPVTFRLHSRRQSLADVVQFDGVRNELNRFIWDAHSTCPDDSEYDKWLRSLGHFEDAFLDDFYEMLRTDIALPKFEGHSISVSGGWFATSIWETVILSAVSEVYSRDNVEPPDQVKRFSDVHQIGESGAYWADFGTRRRYSRGDHDMLISYLAEVGHKYGFIGTSNMQMAQKYDLTPIGTYAHELEMVLRPYFHSEFATTRNVLKIWQEMYPHRLRVALTDTYTTPKFLEDHGKFLLDNDWRGVRLDSGNPIEMGKLVDEWLAENNRKPALPLMDVVFSDGLDANAIVNIQNTFGQKNGHPATFIHPVFGWGTGLTNPCSDLSLVMKAVASRGEQTYKITDDETKAIR